MSSKKDEDDSEPIDITIYVFVAVAIIVVIVGICLVTRCRNVNEYNNTTNRERAKT